jgi:hypothetical protein
VALAGMTTLAACGGAATPPAKTVASAATAAETAAHFTATAVGPAGDAFYRPPSPLPTGQPGDLLRYRQVPAAGPLAALGATVDEVLYLSTDALGKPDVVSGTVVLPAGVDLSKAPVLSYAAGTHGIGDQCAPSKAIASGSDYGLPDISAAVGHGWVVTATDYQGLGTPGIHTYVVGRSEGHAVIDAVRAAMRLPGAHPAPGARIAYWGYSQGGGAAAWAGELTASYAPELHVVGEAAGGVPADLVAVSKGLEGSAQVGLELMAAVGFDAAYPDLKLDSFLTPRGKSEIDSLRTGCIGAIAAFAGQRISDITTSDPIDTVAWRHRLAENDLGSTPPAFPIYLYHGTKDTTVAFAQDKALMRTYCAKHVAVVWSPFDGDHGAGSSQSPGALAFLTARFAGTPVTSTC